MNKKQYEAKRRELLAEAEKLLADGKAEEAEAKMKEVTDLDEAWEKIAQAQANFAALNREPSAVNVFGANGRDKKKKRKCLRYKGISYCFHEFCGKRYEDPGQIYK